MNIISEALRFSTVYLATVARIMDKKGATRQQAEEQLKELLADVSEATVKSLDETCKCAKENDCTMMKAAEIINTRIKRGEL